MKRLILIWILLFLSMTLGAGFAALDRLNLGLPYFGISGLVAIVLWAVLSLIK